MSKLMLYRAYRSRNSSPLARAWIVNRLLFQRLFFQRAGSVTKKLLAASLNKGSTEVYKRSWKLFTDWAQSSLGDTILVLPLTPAVIALFASHLYSLNYTCSTVTSYLSAIGYAHKLAGVNDPTETAII